MATGRIRRVSSMASAGSVASGRFSNYTAAMDTDITGATFLGDDFGAKNGAGSLVGNARVALEARAFGALDALTSHRTVSNVLSAIVLFFEFGQYVSVATAGRFAEKWNVELNTFFFSTWFMGYFESSFGVLAVCYVGVLGAMFFALVSALLVSSSICGARSSVGSYVFKAYVLRWLLIAFLTVGYLPASVILLRIPAMCLPWRPDAPRDAAGRLLVSEYADEGMLCGSPQTLLMSFVGVLGAGTLMLASVVLKAVYHDTDPTSASIQARSHSRIAVVEVIVRTVVTIMFVISNSLANDVILMSVLFLGSWLMLYLYYIHAPYFHSGVNAWKVFGSTYLSLYSTMLPIAYFVDLPWTGLSRFLLFTAVICCGIGVAYLSHRRLRGVTAKHRPHLVQNLSDSSTPDMGRSLGFRVDAADPLSTVRTSMTVERSEGLPRFARVTEVELATRELIRANEIGDASLVFERGLLQYPKSALLRLQFAAFLVATGSYPEADVVLDRLVTGSAGSSLRYDFRFGVFALRKALARRRQIEGTMDVASYVKYNARLVEAKRAHAAAMRHVHALWSLVLRSDEEFLQRSARLSESIDKEAVRAEKLFLELLQEYPNVTPILRAYAVFLDEVHHDELKADKLRHRADVLEGRRLHGVGTGDRGGGVGDGGGGGGGALDRQADRIVPNEATDVVLTVSSQGRILSANHNVSAFGYNTDNATGVSVFQLVRIEGTSVHAVMEGYNEGVKRANLELVDGVHRNGTMLRMVADITPVSAGANPKFALVLRPVRQGAVIRHAHDGTVLGATAEVRRLLGWRPSEMVGRSAEEFLPTVEGKVVGTRTTGRASSALLPGLREDGSDSSSSTYSSSGLGRSIVTQVVVRDISCKNRLGNVVSLEAVSSTERGQGGWPVGGRRGERVHRLALWRPEDVCELTVLRDGRILGVGDNSRNVLLRPRRSLVGKEVRSVLPGASAALLRLMVGKRSTHVFPVVATDGARQLCTLAVEAYLVDDPGSGVGGLNNDAESARTARRVSRATNLRSEPTSPTGSEAAAPAFTVVVQLVGSDAVYVNNHDRPTVHAAGLVNSGSGAPLSVSLGSLDSCVSGASIGSTASGVSDGRYARRGRRGSLTGSAVGSSYGEIGAGNIGGTVRRSHRFRVRSYSFLDKVLKMLSLVSSVALIGFFVWALLIRSSLRQTPIRMGLHAQRSRALADGITELRSVEIAWSLARRNLSDLAGLTFAYDPSAYRASVELSTAASAVLLDGNATVWSVFEANEVMAEWWTNSSRASLVIPSGDCSDATHVRNVTFEGAIDLMNAHMVQGLGMTNDVAAECEAVDALPGSLYALLRNGADNLRRVVHEGLEREAGAGVTELGDLARRVYIAAAVLCGAVILLTPAFLYGVDRIRRERERAVLAFSIIPKTDAAAIASETRRYGSTTRSATRRVARKKKLKQKARQKKRDEAKRKQLFGGSSQAVASSGSALAIELGHSVSNSGSSSSSSARDPQPLAGGGVGSSSPGRMKGIHNKSAIFDGSMGSLDGRLNVQPRLSRDSLDANLSGSRSTIQFHMSNVGSVKDEDDGGDDSNGSGAYEDDASRLAGPRDSGSLGEMGEPKARKVKATRPSTPRLKPGVLKAASRTNYVPPSRPRRAWEESRGGSTTAAYTRTLLKGLAPSMSNAVIMCLFYLVVVASGMLHFVDTAASEERLDNYAASVRRVEHAEYLVWIMREFWLSRVVGFEATSIFADEALSAEDVLRTHLDGFEAANRMLTTQPATAEEVLLRAECVMDQPLSGLGLEAMEWAELGSGSGANGTCITIKLAVQVFTRTVAAMLDGLADPGTSAEDLSGQMEALWTMGDEVIVDTLARSADLYFAAAADYSQGYQTLIYAIQNLVMTTLSLGIFRKMIEAYFDDTQRVINMLRIIPHRIAETSLEVEEYLRTLE